MHFLLKNSFFREVTFSRKPHVSFALPVHVLLIFRLCSANCVQVSLPLAIVTRFEPMHTFSRIVVQFTTAITFISGLPVITAIFLLPSFVTHPYTIFFTRRFSFIPIFIFPLCLFVRFTLTKCKRIYFAFVL